MQNKVLIIIPTLNEEKNIVSLTNKILKINPKYEILIVDDSACIYKRPKKLIKKVKFIKRKVNDGRCGAVLYGIKNGLNKRFDIFIEMDADFSHNPNELKRNISYFLKKKLDLLIASRYLKTSKIVNWSTTRRIFSYLSNKLAQLLLGYNFTDYTNGYRIYSRRASKLIIKNCGFLSKSFITLSDIIITLKNNSYKIAEIDSLFVNRVRGDSKISIKLVLVSLYGLFKIFFFKRLLNF